MNTTLGSQSINIDRYKSRFAIHLLKISVIIAVVIASFWGIFDKKSETYVDQSLKQAVVVYGVARGTNAVISVAQSFQIPFITPGEILDPVNDLVERFSTLMELSIGSLVLQKLLIEITTHAYFNYAIAAIGLLVMLTMFVLKEQFYMLSLRFFLSVIFFRFAIVLVLFFNGMVSDTFVAKKISDETSKLDKVVKQASVLAEVKAVTAVPIVPTKPRDEGIFERIGASFSEVKQKIVSTVSATFEPINPKLIKEKLENTVESMLRLMALFFLQTILLPVLFLYVFKRVLSSIWQAQANVMSNAS